MSVRERTSPLRHRIPFGIYLWGKIMCFLNSFRTQVDGTLASIWEDDERSLFLSEFTPWTFSARYHGYTGLSETSGAGESYQWEMKYTSKMIPSMSHLKAEEEEEAGVWRRTRHSQSAAACGWLVMSWNRSTCIYTARGYKLVYCRRQT